MPSAAWLSRAWGRRAPCRARGVSRPGGRHPCAVVAVFLAATLALAALLPVVFPSAATAQVKSWRIESVDASLQVLESSDVVVDETVTFAFNGDFSYVTRSIPTGNLEGIDDFAVLRNGAPLPEGTGPGSWELSNSGGRRIVRVNFADDAATQTYTFHYVARGAIHYFDDGDELRWYVFDAETPVPIGSVRATVRLPGSLGSDQLTGAISTGPSVPSELSHPAPSTLVYTASLVPPYTQFWIVAGFPKDVVQFQLTARRAAAFVVPKAGFLLPILTFLGMLLLWRRRGRDDPQAAYARFVTEPPSDLPPAVVGALIDERVDVKELVATIVDLARRGYLTLVEEEEDSDTAAKSVTTFRRLKPTAGLNGVDHMVMKALFAGASDEVSTEDLKVKFYQHVQPICTEVYADATSRRLFAANPQTTRRRWLGAGFALLVSLGLLTFGIAATGIGGWGFFLAGSIVSAVIVMAFARAMPARTPKGAQEVRRWEAFRNYLRDLTRFEDMENAREVFDRSLPYAIAMGVERDWVRRFHDLTVPAPDWYRPVLAPTGAWAAAGAPGSHTAGLPSDLGGGGGGGGAGLPSLSLDSVSDSLFRSLNGVSGVLTSLPSGGGGSGGGSSSGGGGSSGGGFSGGGGGGGFGAG